MLTRRLLALLGFVCGFACSDSDTPPDFVAMCNEVGQCIVDGGCIDLRLTIQELRADGPCAMCISDAECEACLATPEGVAWQAEYDEARAAWVGCVELCTAPFVVDELDIEHVSPRCFQGGEASEYCAVGIAYNSTLTAPDFMEHCSDVG